MLRGRTRSLIPGRWRFSWRYLFGKAPWDTGVTPPEVVEFLERTEPGSALDLGCGTGTNSIEMARRGWKVTGVDFVPRAIRRAFRKAERAGVTVDFRVADVSDLRELSGPYDYALDLGCLHSLPETLRPGYAVGLRRLLRPGGTYMLYSWLPRIRHGGHVGMMPSEVEGMLGASFEKERVVVGEEREFGSAWYWFRRTVSS